MRFRRSYHNNISFLDLLFNGWLIYVFLFIVSFILIVPERNEADIKTKAEFVITLTWDDESSDDIDIWVQDPNLNIVYYRQEEKGLTHLDRDDLGTTNDKVVLPTGEVVEVKQNQEIVTIRGFMSGEWVINIHMYRKNDQTPTKANVKMVKLNPSVKEIFQQKYVMKTYWEEITVVRFQMSAQGEVLELSDLPKKLIKSSGSGAMIVEGGHP